MLENIKKKTLVKSQFLSVFKKGVPYSQDILKTYQKDIPKQLYYATLLCLWKKHLKKYFKVASIFVSWNCFKNVHQNHVDNLWKTTLYFHPFKLHPKNSSKWHETPRYLVLLHFICNTMIIYGDNDDKILVKENVNHILPLTLFAIGGRRGEGGRHIMPAADSFICCGSIRDLKKVKFLENC